MKLIWNEDEECFKNENNKGKRYWLLKHEAEQVIQAHALGYTAQEIFDSNSFQSGKVGVTTIRNFLKRFDKGDVVFERKGETLQEDVTELCNRVRLLEDWRDQFQLNWLGKFLFKKRE